MENQFLTNRPVFVAEQPWRGRAVRAGVAAAGLLLLGWLVAIVIGALGFGSLPAVAVTSGAEGRGSTSQARTQTPNAKHAESASSVASVRSTTSRSTGSSGQNVGIQSETPNSRGGPGGSVATTQTQTQSAATIPGSIGSSGNGRGAPTTKPVGVRGAVTTTPSGNRPGDNAHGSNPNADGSNAHGKVLGTHRTG
jgi:hypothetical protein